MMDVSRCPSPWLCVAQTLIRWPGGGEANGSPRDQLREMMTLWSGRNCLTLTFVRGVLVLECAESMHA